MIDYVARAIAIIGLLTSVSKILYDIWKETKCVSILIDEGVLDSGIKVIGITIHNKSNIQITILGVGIYFSNGVFFGTGEFSTRINKKVKKVFANFELTKIQLPCKLQLGDPIRLTYPLNEVIKLYKDGEHIERIYCFDSERKIFSCRLPMEVESWIKKNMI